MRLLAAIGLVLAMSGNEIERAQVLARARDSERQQFHQRYLFSLTDPVVAQIEVITEFRRLVMISEDHVLRGDSMFTRGTRAAEEAMAPWRGRISVKAQIRFSPLNTYVEAPPYTLAFGTTQLDTTLTPQFSLPFRTRDGKTLTSLVGAELEAEVPTTIVGQTVRDIVVTLDGRKIAGTRVDFAALD